MHFILYTDNNRTPKMRLECLNVYQLYGNVMSLQAVSLSGSLQDALLISFKDAKLSVLQHDPDTFQLKTLSLHFFEEDDLKVFVKCLFSFFSYFYIMIVLHL